MNLAKSALPVAAAAALLAPSFAAPANAATPDVTDPSTVLAKDFSQFLDRDDKAGNISDGAAARSDSASASSLTVDPAIDQVPSVKLGSSLQNHSKDNDGYTVLTDANEDAAQYIRADAAGATVLSTAEDASSGDSFKFKLSDGVKSVAKSKTDAPFVFLDNGEQIALRSPTVKDADGKTLDAEYNVEGDTVEVAVDSTQADSASYPLVAASGFEYLKDYDIGATGPYAAQQALKKDGNFNKIFPVKGAPADFPEKGDILPLRAPLDSDKAFNFECKMGDEASFGDGDAYSYGYNFLATKNHIDGAGSSIQFEIANHDGNRNALYVHAVVKNDAPGKIPKSLYMAGANMMWQDFAYNLEYEV